MGLAKNTIINNDVTIMAKGVLPFKYENKKTNAEVTSWAGLPVYLDLARTIWLSKSIGKHLYRFPELCSEIWNCGISGCRKKVGISKRFFHNHYKST